MGRRWNVRQADNDHVEKSIRRLCSHCDLEILIEKDVFVNPLDGKQTVTGTRYIHDTQDQEEACAEIRASIDLLRKLTRGGRL